jgi:hypothetical protein
MKKKQTKTGSAKKSLKKNDDHPETVSQRLEEYVSGRSSDSDNVTETESVEKKFRKNGDYAEAILQRLEEYISGRGENFNHLTSVIGTSSAYFAVMRKNKGTIGTDMLIRILSHYKDLSADWLLLGSGSMLRKGTERQEHERREQKSQERQQTVSDFNAAVNLLEYNIATLKGLQDRLNKLR